MRLFFALAVLSLSAAASAQDEPPPPPAWEGWLAELKSEALAAGVGQATVAAALEGLEPNPRVIELDRRQPEFTQTFEDYLAARVSEVRVARGREMMGKHAATLAAVGEAYGVQPRFIVAIWGLETNYGATTGNMAVVRSLATLAWDRRRSDYFRGQLLAALKIVDAGHIGADAMLGSWAGAMGQSQFMPGSFLTFAQDFDGDGRRDIWTTEADVFASIANYLAKHGWSADTTWGRRVLLPENWGAIAPQVAQETPPRACGRALKHHTKQLPLRQWQELGVRRMNGTALPDRDLAASLVQPGDSNGPAFLTYSNYRAILSYNCSNHYAMAVGHLADALRQGR